MKLTRQHKVPYFFEKEDTKRNKVSLRHNGEMKTLLCFFRGVTCPFCNLRVRELMMNAENFEQNNIRLILIFNSSADEINKNSWPEGFSYPIIADPTLELYKAYGIEESFKGMIKGMMRIRKMGKIMKLGLFSTKSMKDRHILPADFFLDKELNIIEAYYGRDFGDHINLKKLFQ